MKASCKLTAMPRFRKLSKLSGANVKCRAGRADREGGAAATGQQRGREQRAESSDDSANADDVIGDGVRREQGFERRSRSARAGSPRDGRTSLASPLVAGCG